MHTNPSHKNIVIRIFSILILEVSEFLMCVSEAVADTEFKKAKFYKELSDTAQRLLAVSEEKDPGPEMEKGLDVYFVNYFKYSCWYACPKLYSCI